MNAIDSVVINFSPEKLAFLNICLGFLLFGVALDIKVSHFQDIYRYPKAFLTGVFGQLVLMPILTIILIFVIPMPTSMKLGMILVCACPGGNTSNYAVYLAEGNTAEALSALEELQADRAAELAEDVSDFAQADSDQLANARGQTQQAASHAQQAMQANESGQWNTAQLSGSSLMRTSTGRR